MIRRSVIEETGIRFDPAFVHAEDYEFFTRLCAYGEIGNVLMLGYRYRIHAKSVSNRHAEVQRAPHLLLPPPVTPNPSVSHRFPTMCSPG